MEESYFPSSLPLFIACVANANICARGRARGGWHAAVCQPLDKRRIDSGQFAFALGCLREKKSGDACIRRFLEFVTAGRHAPRAMRKMACWMRKAKFLQPGSCCARKAAAKWVSEWVAFSNFRTPGLIKSTSAYLFFFIARLDVLFFRAEQKAELDHQYEFVRMALVSGNLAQELSI